MELNKSDASFSTNQLIALNRFLYIYKFIGIGLIILCLVLGGAYIKLVNQSPIVVVAKDNDLSYYQGRFLKVSLNEGNIKHFVEKFIDRYYNWSDLNPEVIFKNTEPFITDGLKESTLANLKIRKEKDFFGKKLQQSVAGLSVQVTKESTIAIFDVVLRVDNIPLVVPTQVSLQLVKGIQTEWNPMGLYVNSITIHEGR